MFRVFYVVEFKNPYIQGLLNSIRYVANPNEKGRAHITVRGPYRQRYHIASETDGALVHVQGVGSFRGPNQNTVLLTCASDALKAAWRKPDYPYSPHVTLYDGHAKDFSVQLEQIARRRFSPFFARIGPLYPYVVSRRQRTTDLVDAVDFESLSWLLGMAVSASSVRRFSDYQRLEVLGLLMAELCRRAECQQAL